MKDETFPLTPPSDHGQSRDEIAAEIADHLAAAEAELTKSGTTPENAHEAARKKFGDVEKIKQTCFWIQNGETIMLRWTLISLAAVLCILLGLSVLGNWRTQSQLADEMGKLSAELKSLAAASQTPPPAPQPPEITGVIYTGSKDKPLAGASVAILRADGTVVRRMSCDEKGVYHSGPLEPGDYCVTSPVKDGPEILDHFVAQSEPVFLHSGSGSFALDLDPEYHSGGIKIVANRPLPELRKDGKYLIKSRLEVRVFPLRRRSTLWTPVQDSPPSWPVFCYPSVPTGESRRRGTPLDRIRSTVRTLALDDKRTAEVSENLSAEPARFPTGKTDITLALMVTVMPLDEKGDILLIEPRINGILHLRRSIVGNSQDRFHAFPWAKLEDESLWQVVSNGQPWLDHLAARGVTSYERSGPQPPPREEIEVREGAFASLQVEIPEGVETEIQKVAEEISDVQQFSDLVNQGLLQRPLKTSAVHYEPIGK